MAELNRWVVVAVAALVLALVALLTVDRISGFPGPDATSYEQLSESLRGGGYSVDIEGEPEGSRYPPGFPLLLAMLSPIADAPMATLILTAALAVAVWASAWKAGGPIAATVAVLMVVFYLRDHEYTGAVMADTTGALFVVLPLLALQHGRQRLAGVLAGFSAWVKLLNVVVGGGLPRRSLPPFLGMLGVLLATKLLWGWGYRSSDASWGLSHLWSTDGLASTGHEYPNLVAYPLMLLGVTGGMTVPGAVFLAGWAVWRRPERRFVLVSSAGVVAVCLPYFFQADRFLFPVVALIAVYSGAAVSDLVSRSVGGVELGEQEPDDAVHLPGERSGLVVRR